MVLGFGLLAGLFPFKSVEPVVTVRVAILDTGVDEHHPWLRDSLWLNPAEIPDNGRDDDGNGLVDDVHGWNFAQGDADLRDQDGHGTHVAGIIKQTVARRTSSRGLQLMILKYDRSSFVTALEYAVEKDVDILNISGGGRRWNLREWELLRQAQVKGMLVVAAAGNKAPRQKSESFFPAAYRLNNIYSVMATDSSGRRLETSNVNPRKRNFSAPGERIYSSLPSGRFGLRTGSSQAAAVFTGELAARLLEPSVSITSNKFHN